MLLKKKVTRTTACLDGLVKVTVKLLKFLIDHILKQQCMTADLISAKNNW